MTGVAAMTVRERRRDRRRARTVLAAFRRDRAVPESVYRSLFRRGR